MFDGTLHKYSGSDYYIEFQENSKPYHNKSFSTLNDHKPTRKKLID